MNNSFSLTIIQILIFCTLELLQCQNSKYLDVAYSPFYLNKIDFKQENGVPYQLKVAKDVELVFIGAGFGGIVVMDKEGKEKIFSQKMDELFINVFDVTRDGRFLIVGQNSKIITYEFINPLNQTSQQQQFVQVGSADFTTEIQDLVYSSMEKIICAVGTKGQVIVYSFKDMPKVTKLSSFNTGSDQILGVSMSEDGQWIYLACYRSGILVLRLTWQEREANLVLASKDILNDNGPQAYKVVVPKNQQFIFQIQNWYGLLYAKLNHVITSKVENYPTYLNFTTFWPFKVMSPSCYSISMSHDDSMLFVGVRSQGLLIFDVSQNDIKFYQQIQIDAQSLSIQLSKSGQYLYYSNSFSVFTFLRVDPNLNEDYPNLFNVHQAIQNNLQLDYKWKCYIEPTNQYFIGDFDYDGLYIMKYYDDPSRLDVLKPLILKQYLTDSVDLDPQGKYLYVSEYYSNKLISVLQVKPDDKENKANISFLNPKEVYSYHIQTKQVAEQMVFSKDRQFVVMTYITGIILLDSSDPLNFKQLSYWQMPGFMLKKNVGAMITNDNRWILGTVRNYGIFALDAQNKTNLILTDYINTRGGEGIQMSQIYDEYAYFMDGLQGFAIIDLKSLPKINIISRFYLIGWTQVILPLKNENYILVGSMENGMLTLLDIRDKYNIKKFSSYRRDKQYATSICGPKSGDYVFIANPQGIISLPLKSIVRIHTEVSEVITSSLSNSKITIRFDKEEALKNTKGLSQNDYLFRVGQSIQLNFVILYPQDEEIHISDINIYENGQVLSIPYYMTYDFPSQSLNIQVDKLALGSEKENAKLNTILIKSIIPLRVDQFFYQAQDETDKALTSMEQAQMIVDHLITLHILNNKRLVTQFFDFDQTELLDDNFFKNKLQLDILQSDYKQISRKINKKVLSTLMKSTYINPVIFYVQPSLIFDLNNQEQSINSLSSVISVLLQIDKKNGKFVTQDYTGVIFSTSEDQDQIKLEGSITSVNNILKQKIIFSNYTELIMQNQNDQNKNKQDQHNSNSTDTPKLIITVYDNINYPIIKTLPINECIFIKLKQKFAINITLQHQFDKQFPDSVVYIETELTIQFADNTFYASDSKQIKYKIQMEDDDSNYVDISPDFWLQSQGDSNNAYRGNAPPSDYLKIYRFRVNATDGYVYEVDYFTIKVYGLPFLILGPIFTLLGIYKQRSVILNMIFKNDVTFDEEIIYCGQKYYKKIILLGSVLQDSKILVNLLFSKNSKQLNSIDDNESIKSQNGAPHSQLFFQESEKNIIRKAQQQKLLMPSKAPSKINLNKTLKILNQMESHIRNSILEKIYLKPKGCLNMSKIISDILFNKLTTKHLKQLSTTHDYSSDIKNLNSKIYRAVRSQVARYFLQMDKRSQFVYEFIKKYCYQNICRSQNDWYKSIIEITSTKEIDQNSNLIIFPQLSFKMENFIKILIELEILPQNIEKKIPLNFHNIVNESDKNEKSINFYLIREALFADALGLSEQIPSLFQPSIGESIHLNSFNIKQIIAYKKGNYKWWIQKIFEFFNQEYQVYGISKNIKIPTWIHLDWKHNTLILHGVPTTEDVEEVLIRIYDLFGYVIKQFHIKVIKPIENEDFCGVSLFSIPDETVNEAGLYESCQLQNSNILRSQFSYKPTQLTGDRKKNIGGNQSPLLVHQDTVITRQQSIGSQSLNNSHQDYILRSLTRQPSQFQNYEFIKNKNNKNSICDQEDEQKIELVNQNLHTSQDQMYTSKSNSPDQIKFCDTNVFTDS